MSTCHTAAQVHGVSWYAKNLDRTCTRSTHFGSTVGSTVPVLNTIYTPPPLPPTSPLLVMSSMALPYFSAEGCRVKKDLCTCHWQCLSLLVVLQ